MKLKIENLKSRQQTIDEILRLSYLYSKDIIKESSMPLLSFFNWLKMMPYKKDKIGLEVVKRPNYIKYDADCKKKTILAISYAINNKIPFRIVTMSNRPDKIIHHVFPQFYLKKWINFDATYSFYYLAQPKIGTNYIIYKNGKQI